MGAIKFEGYEFIPFIVSDNQVEDIEFFNFIRFENNEEVWFVRKDQVIQVIFKIDNNIKTKKLIKSMTIEDVENPNKEGYEFVGWYNSGKEFDPNTKIYEDIELDAKFEINEYMVKFLNMDGSLLKEIKVSHGDSIIDVPEALEVNGYLFKNWDHNLKDIKTDLEVNPIYDAIIFIGDELHDNDNVVINRVYNDNSVKSDDIGNIPITYGSEDITQDYVFRYFSIDKSEEITSFDLSKGGTTFKVYYEATSTKYEDIKGFAIFKYGSVRIGDSEDFYTIEDALLKAKDAVVYVEYNTTFSDHNIALDVYNKKDFIVDKNVTLLLPYDDNKSLSLVDNVGTSNQASAINKKGGYVELFVPENINIDVYGTLTVNAQRGNNSTRNSGVVHSDKYATINLSNNSSINVKKEGHLNVIGYIYGEGIVIAESYSQVVEPIFVKSFRGGSATTKITSEVFPFNQFTVNHIETEFIINESAEYIVSSLIYMSRNYYASEIKLIGKEDKNLINLEDGYVVKTYNYENGKVTISIHGNVSINEGSINILGISSDLKNLDVPFDGTWKVDVKSGSKLTINSKVLLLPGAEINIEEGSELLITEKGRLTVHNPYDLIYDYTTYPNVSSTHYRVPPKSFGFTKSSSANLNIYGDAIVLGGIAGRINVDEIGSLNIEQAETEYVVAHVIGSAGEATIQYRVFRLMNKNDKLIDVQYDKKEVKTNEEIVIKIILKDEFNNPIPNTMVKFSGGEGLFEQKEINTDDKGYAEFKYIMSEHDDEDAYFDLVYEALGKTGKVSVKRMPDSEGGNSPFIYSKNKDGYNFEHEPISLKLLKTVEGTSYGTLRLLEDIDGIYYIQIVEEGKSTTILNNLELYAVDYIDDKEILDLFFDINGNPHTIKEKILPKSFIDENGISHLNKLKDNEKVFDIGSNSSLTYLTATFERPNNNRFAKFMVSLQDVDGGSQDILKELIQSMNGSRNYWLIDKAFSNSKLSETAIKNVLGALEVKVQVLINGKWEEQASIELGSYLMEEFLVELDLKDIKTKDVNVRLVFPTKAGYAVGGVFMDFSENVDMEITKLDLVSAIMNDKIDILEEINIAGSINKELQYKESIELGFSKTEISPKYKRGFGVKVTGVIYPEGAKTTDDIEEKLTNKTFEEIKDILIENNRFDLMEDIDKVKSLYDKLVKLGQLDYREIVENFYK